MRWGGGRWRWGEEKRGGGVVLRLKYFRFGITYIYIDLFLFFIIDFFILLLLLLLLVVVVVVVVVVGFLLVFN